ncbi:hypothetical protein T484DRAFT_3287443 [Baffinella frigidus]|nr:hypothetical protein T484DRAFT_3287443 [Cryptophyta sp. CCMP2293]
MEMEGVHQVRTNQPAGTLVVHLENADGSIMTNEGVQYPTAFANLLSSLKVSVSEIKPDGTDKDVSKNRKMFNLERGENPAIFGELKIREGGVGGVEFPPGTPLRQAGEYVVKVTYEEKRSLMKQALSAAECTVTASKRIMVQALPPHKLKIIVLEHAGSSVTNTTGNSVGNEIVKSIELALQDSEGNQAIMPLQGVDVAWFIDDGDAPVPPGTIVVDQSFNFCNDEKRAKEIKDLDEPLQKASEAVRKLKEGHVRLTKNIDHFRLDKNKKEIAYTKAREDARRYMINASDVDMQNTTKVEEWLLDYKHRAVGAREWSCEDPNFKSATELEYCKAAGFSQGVIGELIVIEEKWVADLFAWRFAHLLITAIFTDLNPDIGVECWVVQEVATYPTAHGPHRQRNLHQVPEREQRAGHEIRLAQHPPRRESLQVQEF